MPKNPEREGSPRLMTISEIAAEYGVSRTSVHNYRRGGTFPRPAPVEGTEKTKLRFRADEVAAWFEANPKQQGKRTDLADKQQGEPAVVEGQMGTQPLKTVTIQTPMPDSRARALAALVYREGGHLEITLEEMLAAPDQLIVSSTEGGGIILRDPAAHEWDGQGEPSDEEEE